MNNNYYIRNNKIIVPCKWGGYSEYGIKSVVCLNCCNRDKIENAFYIHSINYDTMTVNVKTMDQNKSFSNMKYIGCSPMSQESYNNKNNWIHESISIDDFLNKYHVNYGFKF